jgi:hypothetical protein
MDVWCYRVDQSVTKYNNWLLDYYQTLSLRRLQQSLNILKAWCYCKELDSFNAGHSLGSTFWRLWCSTHCLSFRFLSNSLYLFLITILTFVLNTNPFVPCSFVSTQTYASFLTISLPFLHATRMFRHSDTYINPVLLLREWSNYHLLS